MVVHVIIGWYIVCDSDEYKEIDMGRSCSTHMRIRSAYKDLDRKPERESTWETFVPM
jgi:hypothetical protein